MKKLILALLISIQFLTLTPQRSHAGLAVLTGNIGFGHGAIVAIYLSVPFGVLVGLGSAAFGGAPIGEAVGRGMKATLFSFIAGLVLLDEQSGETELLPIRAEEKSSLGLTDAEMLAYNSERLELEFIREEIYQSVLEQNPQGLKNAEQFEAARIKSLAAWEAESHRVSPLAYSTMKKVFAHRAQQAQ